MPGQDLSDSGEHDGSELRVLSASLRGHYFDDEQFRPLSELGGVVVKVVASGVEEQQRQQQQQRQAKKRVLVETAQGQRLRIPQDQLLPLTSEEGERDAKQAAECALRQFGRCSFGHQLQAVPSSGATYSVLSLPALAKLLYCSACGTRNHIDKGLVLCVCSCENDDNNDDNSETRRSPLTDSEASTLGSCGGLVVCASCMLNNAGNALATGVHSWNPYFVSEWIVKLKTELGTWLGYDSAAAAHLEGCLKECRRKHPDFAGTIDAVCAEVQKIMKIHQSQGVLEIYSDPAPHTSPSTTPKATSTRTATSKAQSEEFLDGFFAEAKPEQSRDFQSVHKDFVDLLCKTLADRGRPTDGVEKLLENYVSRNQEASFFNKFVLHQYPAAVIGAGRSWVKAAGLKLASRPEWLKASPVSSVTENSDKAAQVFGKASSAPSISPKQTQSPQQTQSLSKPASSVSIYSADLPTSKAELLKEVKKREKTFLRLVHRIPEGVLSTLSLDKKTNREYAITQYRNMNEFLVDVDEFLQDHFVGKSSVSAECLDAGRSWAAAVSKYRSIEQENFAKDVGNIFQGLSDDSPWQDVSFAGENNFFRDD